MSARPSVYHQGASIYVIGTDDAHEACRAAGISPETHRWGGTDFGWYVRRKNGWQVREELPHLPLPKDARPGVRFGGPVRRIEETP